MHPTPISRPFHREGWVYELEVDGWRILAYKRGTHVQLVSRNNRNHTKRFPGIVAAIRELDPYEVVLDGEVAVFDRQLMSRFEWLRHRAAPGLATPPIFIAFEFPVARGKDLRERPLYVRRT
jgi:bifunctional non-homologous end joining protein LigD